MTYVINWTQTGTPPNGKPSILLPPLTVDSTSSSLTLTGKGTPNYGEIQQENFLRLLENFACPTSPSQPTIGQTWFNTADNSLYQFTISGWRRVGGIFSDASAPAPAYVSDLWWDLNNNKLFIYSGATWEQIWPSLSVIPVAYVDEYNSLVDKYNKIASTPASYVDAILPNSSVSAPIVIEQVYTYDGMTQGIDGIFTYDGAIDTTATAPEVTPPPAPYAVWYGYNQAPIPHATLEDMTNAKWVELLIKFKALAQHQGSDVASFETNGFILNKDSTYGIVKALDEYRATLPVVDMIEKNRFIANPMTLESSVLPNSSYARTASYFAAKTHNVALTFTSLDHARAFFNAGGKARISATFTAGQSTSFSVAWATFIGSLGHITFGAKNTTYTASADNTPGFYDLTLNGAFITIFVASSSVPGSYGASYSVKARLEQAPNTSAVTLRFNMVFAPDDVSSIYSTYSSSNSAAIGVTNSSITTLKPSALFLDSPEIAYPVATQSGTFVTDQTV